MLSFVIFAQILEQLKNIPLSSNTTSAASNSEARDQKSSFSMDVDTEEHIRLLSVSCLSKSLDVFDVATSIFLDTRVTRAKLIFHSTSPPAAANTNDCGEEEYDESVLWRIESDPAQNTSEGRKVVLTESGEKVLINLFRVQGAQDSDIPKITKTVMSVMLEPNHALCDKSISILRRSFGTLNA